MKTSKEIRQENEELWQENLDIEKKMADEKRGASEEELARMNEILDTMSRNKLELEIAEKREGMAPLMAENTEDRKIIQEPVEKPNDDQGFESKGHFYQAVIRAGSNVGDGYIGGKPSGRVDRRLLNESAEERAVTGMSEGVPQDGGFLVQQDFSNELLKMAHNTGVLANLTRKQPISAQSNSIKITGVDETSRTAGNRWGGIRGYWASEAETKTKSKPKFRIIELGLNKLIGLVYLTDELLQDTVALESFVSQGFAEEFGFQIDDSLINGNGVGMPQGILNANTLVSVSKETGQAAQSIVAENIEKMYSRIFSTSIGNAKWFINQDCWPQIFQLHHAVGTGGVPMFIPAGGINQTPFGTLLGRPLQPIEQCQTLGTKGDIYLADFSQYITADKGSMQSASSIHVRFINDETVMRFVMRFDGQPIRDTALTPFKGSNTQSAFISLNTRS